MDYSSRINRYANRSDLSLSITHLTRGDSIEEAYDTLWKILNEKRLVGHSNPAESYISGSRPAVCFQDGPLRSIVENLLFEKRLRVSNGDRLRYSPFGIRVDKRYAMNKGARPVIYGPKDEMDSVVTEENYWRYVSLDLRSDDDITDWMHEREWRAPSPFQFEYEFIDVVLLDPDSYRKFISDCMRKNSDILSSIRSITCIEQLL